MGFAAPSNCRIFCAQSYWNHYFRRLIRAPSYSNHYFCRIIRAPSHWNHNFRRLIRAPSHWNHYFCRIIRAPSAPQRPGSSWQRLAASFWKASIMAPTTGMAKKCSNGTFQDAILRVRFGHGFFRKSATRVPRDAPNRPIWFHFRPFSPRSRAHSVKSRLFLLFHPVHVHIQLKSRLFLLFHPVHVHIRLKAYF